jgi:hypothetical protein
VERLLVFVFLIGIVHDPASHRKAADTVMDYGGPYGDIQVHVLVKAHIPD